MGVASSYINLCHHMKLVGGATVNMMLSPFWTLRLSPFPLGSAPFPNGQRHKFFFSICERTTCSHSF